MGDNVNPKSESSMANDSHVPGISASHSSGAEAAQAAESAAEEIEALVLEAERSMLEAGESALFTPMYMLKDSEKLEKRVNQQNVNEAEELDEDFDRLIDDVTKMAKSFEKKNSEMNHQALLGLKAGIKESDNAEEILAKVRKYYKDEYLADEALEFLEATTNPNMNLGKNIRLARHLLNDRHGREVRAGRNINQTAQEYAKKGLGTTGSLRDLYRDITGDPKEPASLFEELSEAYTFEKMKPILSFILHSLGSDMKSKGPSISKQELSRLFNEARTMQAILGIYRFFYSRMSLIRESLLRENLQCPDQLTFELLAKFFGKYLQERYPSPDKVLRMAKELGIEEEIIAQIIIFTAYRDAMRGVSPKLFRTTKHRQDLLMALIETISELDDLLDDDEDDDEEELGWQSKDTIE